MKPKSPTEPDRCRVIVGFTVGIPNTYSSVLLQMQYETSMQGEDNGDPQRMFLRARKTAQAALDREQVKTFKRLGLDDGGRAKKGRVSWRLT